MAYKSVLHQMAMTTPTHFWNDSCALDELAFAIEHGAVGATTNPVIVGQVLKGDMPRYLPFIKQYIAENPEAVEDDVAWALNRHMAKEGAQLLKPVFEQSQGKAGYISIQTNAKYYKNAQKMIEQAVGFGAIADNIMVKMPTTKAGLTAFEEVVYQGVNINATVSFSVVQAVQVAEAVERGLNRRTAAGLSNEALHPVCTIMIGRTEDWLREVMNAQNIAIDPAAIDFSGVAVFKRAYEIYKENGYRTRLLVAAFRNHYHWSQFIGAEASMTIPPKWIKQFIASDISCESRIDMPVDPYLIEQLQKKFPDFIRAYEPDGMAPEEFEHYGASRRTLMQFLKGYDDMVAMIREVMVNS